MVLEEFALIFETLLSLLCISLLFDNYTNEN